MGGDVVRVPRKVVSGDLGEEGMRLGECVPVLEEVVGLLVTLSGVVVCVPGLGDDATSFVDSPANSRNVLRVGAVELNIRCVAVRNPGTSWSSVLDDGAGQASVSWNSRGY